MCASNASRRFRRVAISVSLIGLGIGACDNPQPPAACGPLPQVTLNTRETTRYPLRRSSQAGMPW